MTGGCKDSIRKKLGYSENDNEYNWLRRQGTGETVIEGTHRHGGNKEVWKTQRYRKDKKAGKI